jgi:ribosomal-protein-alanine N-acetyltransferase
MTLKTVRLTLRPQEQADASALFAILGDEEAMRFWNRPAISHLAVVEELLREQQAAMREGLCLYWTLIQDGEAIGSIDLSLIGDGSAELGFLLRPDRWSLGLASEAVGAVIQHGFEVLGLTGLAAAVQTENRAASRVLEKNRFLRIETRTVTVASGEKRDCTFYLLKH